VHLFSSDYLEQEQTKEEKERHQAKKHQWEQDKIKDYKTYIARFGHGTKKMVRQAQSREKALKRMEERGLTEAVAKDKQFTFFFPECNPLPPPIIQFQNVTFGYSKDKILYRDLDMGFDLDSRVALVGRNGVGKVGEMSLCLCARVCLWFAPFVLFIQSPPPVH
jgi:ATP-binding cassette, subfamily F, member 2